MQTANPIFMAPRMLPLRWGWDDLGEWCANAPKPRWPVGEVWVAHPANVTEDGRHLGEHVRDAPQEMLGDLGRAPPALRMAFAGAESDPLVSDAHVAMWRILAAPFGARCEGGDGGKSQLLRCRAGDTFRVSEGGRLKFQRGVIALEARSSFAPRNQAESEPPVARLACDTKAARATLMRDAALSVEVWRLPEKSRLEPDGETCHVLMALTGGVAVDGRALAKGDGIFLPARGRSVHLFAGRGAEVLVAYPDIVPTAIWRRAPDPDPAAAALSRAATSVANTLADAAPARSVQARAA